MKIRCHATLDFSGEPEPVFRLMLDTESFPACFTGFGLIPAIRKIRLAEPLAVGVRRQIYNADHSVLTETVTVLDKPFRHAYVLSGFSAPFSWLVRQGEADWQLESKSGVTKVAWTYDFTVTSVLVYPVCFALLKFFMQGAMRRCLENMEAVCSAKAKND